MLKLGLTILTAIVAFPGVGICQSSLFSPQIGSVPMTSIAGKQQIQIGSRTLISLAQKCTIRRYRRPR